MNDRFYNYVFAIMIIASFITFSGCASIVSRGKYPISINSTPSGANIIIKNKKGIEVTSGKTPMVYKLKAGNGYFSKASYTVTFQMDGYQTKSVPVNFSFDGWYVGNVVFGGLIGILIVDPLTGAMWRLNTQFINETLSSTSANSEEPSMKIYGYNNIPESWKEKLVRIN